MLGLVAPVCKGCSSFVHTAFRMSQNAGWLVLPRCLFHVDHHSDVFLCWVLFLYLFMMMIMIMMLVMILQRHKFVVKLMMAVSSSSLSPPPSSTSSLSSFSTTPSVLRADDLT